MPCLTDIWSTYASKGAQLIAVCEGWWGSTQAQAKTWLSNKGVTFPAIFEADPYPIGTSYAVGGVPRTFILDASMVIQYDFVGVQECSALKAALDALLKSPILKFMYGIKLAHKFVPRLMQIAYLILNVHTEHMFKDLDVRPSKQFNDVVGRYLDAYMSKGTMPPEDIAAPILNLADDLMAGKPMSLRAGDFIALNNHVRALGKAGAAGH